MMLVRLSLVRRVGALAILGAVVAGPAAAPARADLPEKSYAAVNRALVRDHVLPRYRALEAKSGAMAAAVATLCRQPSPAGLAAARAAYHNALDGWMAVQHLRFGPVELFMRAFRLYFWPQARGKVGPAVDALVRAPKPVPADKVRDISIAAQGFPAVEYLLYRQGEGLALRGAASGRRCGLLGGIARNIHTMAAEIVADWSGGTTSYARTIAASGPKKPVYKDSKEATLAFFKSLNDSLHLIADVKLRAVAGPSIAKARPRLVESRLSRRSMRNIVIDLEALRALYAGDKGTGLGTLVREAGDKKLDALMRRAFRLTLETARNIGKPLDQAVLDPKSRPRVETLILQVRALRQIVATRLAKALDLSVGFNALDGD